MEQLAKIQPILVIAFSVAIIAMLIFVLIWVKKLVNNIIKNKVSFIDLYEVDVETQKKWLSVIVTNQSMNDAILTGLGFVYKNKSFDYREAYIRQFEITGDQIVLSPRSSNKLMLTLPEVEEPLFANVDKKKLKGVKIFASTNTGAIFLGRAKAIAKVLRADFDALVKERKRQDRIDFVDDAKTKKANGQKLSFGTKIKLFNLKVFHKIK